MAMEVVWTRAFTPVLKTQVYSFAFIVFTYLGATFGGSLWYRHHLRKHSPCQMATLVALLVVATFLPGVVCDPRIVPMNYGYTLYVNIAVIMLASIVPFCAILGYLTPRLIDEYAGGDPGRAGEAYAINVLGCILGPLFAGYVLLPWMSERSALLILSLPFLGFYLPNWKALAFGLRAVSGWGAGLLAAWSLIFSNNFEELLASYSNRIEIRRDYAASVTSADPAGTKVLLVNGIGMTILSPNTKFMVHLPLAFHRNPPQSALIICFGMGTSYRSALSWNIDTTAVELVPSVPKAFGFYHADGAQVLSNPKGRVVIDDGRRFLARVRDKYDVIAIDPPPPVEAAGSSLLYSTEFYALIKQHLKPHGILQVWSPPGAELPSIQALARSVCESFSCIRCFGSIDPGGIHILASLDPIEPCAAQELAARLPPGAKDDLLEWSPSPDLTGYFGRVLANELDIKACVNPNPKIRITDDRPYNEYFLLRKMRLF
jgi:spermidine synthase